MPHGFVERSRRHPAGRGPDRGPESVQRRHPDPEPVALLAEPVRGGNAAPLEGDLAEGVRIRHHQWARESAPLAGGRNEKGRQAPAAEARIGRGEHDVRVGDPRVRDERLHSVEYVRVALAHGGRGDRGHVGARLGLGHREAAHADPTDRRLQPLLDEGRAPEQGDRRRSERLEREDGVRQRRVRGEAFPEDAARPEVLGSNRLEPAVGSELRADVARECTGLVVAPRVHALELRGGERERSFGQAEVPVVQKGANRCEVDHPNTGVRFSTNASYASRKLGSSMQIACARASASSASSSVMWHSSLSDFLVTARA